MAGTQSKEQPRGLRVRKLADRSAGRRFDPATGEPQPWPLAGVQIEGGPPPPLVIIPHDWAQRAAAEGWLEFEGAEWVHRPGGPPDDLWRVQHSFRHAQALVLHTVGCPVRYKVTHQPDKYAEAGDTAKVTAEVYASGQTRVDWFYVAELQEA